MSQMYRTLLTVTALTALLAAPLGVRADAPVQLSVRTGESTIIKTPGLTRVAVGDGKIAGVVPIADGEIVVNGKAVGRTSVLVWAGNGRRTYDVTVHEQSLDALRQMLERALGVDGVHVDQLDRSVVLTGTVANAAAMARVNDVIARFTPIASGANVTIVNALAVTRPLGALESELAAGTATSGVHVEPDGKGNLIVSGPIADRTTAERVLARVRALGAGELAAEGKVIDRMETSSVSQVDVKVYVLEVDETAMHQLGIDLQSASFQPDGTYTLGSPQFPAVENPTVGPNGSNGPGIVGRALSIGGFFRSITLAPTLNLILNDGHARILSSPDLMTMPGHQADFLVGGQIPIPYASGPQQIAIQYKDFGVKLQVTPTILSDDSVETIIAPEVSDLDFQDGVSLNGFVVPALKTSRLSTDVVTKAGESIVLGGLLSRQEQRNIQKIPVLGDLPILGKLFRSTQYQNAQTDVVFVMTPEVLTR